MKKILNFIIRIFYHPFTHNPDDFKIKVVESWFSDKYVCFRYSANGGFSWKTINYAMPPFLNHIDYDWEYKSFAVSLDRYIESTLRNFNTYQKIIDYEKDQFKKYKQGNVDVQNERINIKLKRKNLLKELNK